MNLLETLYNRRSVRQYSDADITKEQLDAVLSAGLLAASGKNIKPWELIVVRDREMLKKLAGTRAAGAQMLTGANCAVVVVGDEEKSDVWTEDCSIVMANMHLMADSLGLGSCWIQGRLREAADGRTTESLVQELLGIPANYRLEAILSLGVPVRKPTAHTAAELKLEKIHYEKF